MGRASGTFERGGFPLPLPNAAGRSVSQTCQLVPTSLPQSAFAQRCLQVSLYTIDYDSEGWVQTDTGHQFELYNNLNDDWEVVEMDNVEEIQIVDEALQLEQLPAPMVDQIVDQEMEEVNVVDML